MKQKTLLLTILVSFFALNITAQNNEQAVKTIPYEIEKNKLLDTNRVELELGGADVDYLSSFTYKLYGPKGFIKELSLSEKDSNNVTTKDFPIEIQLEDVICGNYKITIWKKKNNDSDEKILHSTRTFMIVEQAPIINNIEVLINNVKISDSLFISQDMQYENYKICFYGENLNSNFKSVYIYSPNLKLTLIEKSDNFSCYSLSEAWAKEENILAIKPGPQSVTFEREFSKHKTYTPFYINAHYPEFTCYPYLLENIKEGSMQHTITLPIKNVYKGAKLEIIPLNHSQLIQYKKKQINLDNINETTFTINFDTPFNNDDTLSLKLINSDNIASETVSIYLKKTGTSIKISPIEDDNYIIEGHLNEVIFERLSQGVYFTDINLQNNPLILILDNQEAKKDTLYLNHPEILDENKIITQIELKKGYNSEIPFQLQNGENTWKGTMGNVVKYPEYDRDNLNITNNAPIKIYRGNSISIPIMNAKDVYLKEIRKGSYTENSTITYKQIDANDKLFNIRISQKAEDFKVYIQLAEEILDTISFDIIDAPDMIEAEDLITEEGKYFDRITIKNNKDITIGPAYDKPIKLELPKDVILPSDFYLQVYTSYNREVEKIYFDNKSQADIHLNENEFNYGQNFMVKIYSPSNQHINTLIFYRKNRFINRFNITAGISALDFTKNTTTGTTNWQLLNGINLACYYMFENFYATNSRVLGVGPNLFVNYSDDNGVDFRYGASVYLFEKLFVGFSLGQQKPGFVLGLNVSVADFSSLSW